MVRMRKLTACLLVAVLLCCMWGGPALADSGEWMQSGSRWRYRYGDGSYPAGTWEVIGGKWYCFDDAGWMRTGWLEDGDEWYYLGADGAMRTGWIWTGAWYFLMPSGEMATDWIKLGSDWYYLNESGAMVTGWLDFYGRIYYLDPQGVMLTGEQVIDGVIYDFGETGVLREKQDEPEPPAEPEPPIPPEDAPEDPEEKPGVYSDRTDIPVLLSESMTVTAGEIRFVSQVRGDLYYTGYWTSRDGSTLYNSSDKCSTCCLSMALSYLGINALPRDIRDADNSNFYYRMRQYLDYFEEKGIMERDAVSVENYKTSASDFRRMMENYRSDARYSPVMMNMYGSGGVTHFVLVIDDLGDGRYLVVDPGTARASKAVQERVITVRGDSLRTEYKGVSCSVKFTQYVLN